MAIGINENRLKHSLGVARAAVTLGKELLGWNEDKLQEIFVLGFVHDIGYEFVENQTDHEQYGGSLLKRLGFAYADEVFWHGKADTDYDSEELLVLNLADMQTSSNGLFVTMDQRLRDIEERYGQDSTQYRVAADLKGKLENRLSQIKSQG